MGVVVVITIVLGVTKTLSAITTTFGIGPLSQSAGVSIEVRGEGARFDDLMVYRDIYYLSEGRWDVSIPEGHYYMLGDNTQDSSDSREWRLERYRVPDLDRAPNDCRIP